MSRHPFVAAAPLILGMATAPAAPPPAPAGLKVAPLGTSAQVLAWSDTSADETGFVIERRDGSAWVPAATVAADTRRHILSGQPAGIQTYRVSAVNGDGSSAPVQAATLRMNVLFFYADDMGFKDVVANRNPATDGPTIYETPALDTLVSQGVSFTQAYASAPKCVTARRAMQTGMHDFRPEAVAKGGGIGNEMVTIGEAMKAGGYRTCFIGKWHLGGTLVGSTSGGDEDFSSGGLVPHVPPVYAVNDTLPATDPNYSEASKIPSAQGYDVSIAAGEWGAPPISYFASASTGVAGEYWYGLPDLYTTNPSEYLTDRLTAEATGFMDDMVANHASEPFFLMLAHYAVHTPLEAKASDIAYFEARKTAMAAQFAAHPGGALYQNDFSSRVRFHQDQTTYAAMVKSFDGSLAQIRAYLAATRDPRNPGMTLAETTIIVFSSDHGGKSTHWVSSTDPTDIPTSNYPLRQGKTWCYEGGLRVPLVVYWPGIGEAGASSPSLVNGADFYTTFLDMTGSPRVPAQHLDSISFAQVAIQPTLRPRLENFHWFTNADTGTGNPAMGVYRRGDYKAVYHMIRRTNELYDLAEDVSESNDIASIRPDLAAEMLRKLIAKRDALGANPSKPGTNSWTKELEVVGPVMTLPAIPSGPPSALAGAAVSTTAIDLTWTDGSNNEERFVIERKTAGGGSFLEVATVPANATRYRDTGLTPGAVYQYRIQAETLSGWAGPSNQITVPTPAASAALPLIARGDDITTLANETREFDPLANDQGEGLAISSITQPSLGAATVVGNAIRFVPATGAVGETMMTYTATGASGATATGAILITILAGHTVAPDPVYDMSPSKTMVDDWEFNDAAGTTIGNCANSANAALKFASGATPATDGSGSLKIVSSGGAGNLFRVTGAVSPGTRTLGDAGAGIHELTVRFAAANLSGGDSDGAYASFAFRDTLTSGSPELFAIRLQKTAAGELQLQYRNAGSVVIASIASNILPNAVEVRAEADMAARTVTVYYNTGSGEVKKGTYPMHTGGVYWNTYRLSASNNSTDFGAADFISIDYARIKSLAYPRPPTGFQMWMDAAEGSTVPSPEKAALADADGDGVENIAEYAFGGNPYQGGAVRQFPARFDTTAGAGAPGELIVTLPVLPGTRFSRTGGVLTGTGAGLTYTIEGSLDLSDFSQPVEEIQPALESGLVPVPRGWEYRSFRVSASNGAPRAFMRAGARP